MWATVCSACQHLNMADPLLSAYAPRKDTKEKGIIMTLTTACYSHLFCEPLPWQILWSSETHLLLLRHSRDLKCPLKQTNPPPWLCESGCPLGEILWYLLRGIPTLAPVDRAFDSLSAGLPRITYQWRQAEKRSTVWMPTLKLWGASTRLERGESAKKT